MGPGSGDRGEYTGGEFTEFLKEQGTERRLTTHDRPQHNGVAESLNRCLVERVHTVLHQSGLPKTLWAEALHFVVWVKNRTLTRALGNIMLLEELTGKEPNIAGVPEWGQRVWVHTTTNSKLDARAATAHRVGYNGDSTHAHRIYWAEQRNVSQRKVQPFPPQLASLHPFQLHHPRLHRRHRPKHQAPHQHHSSLQLPPIAGKRKLKSKTN